jgi:hypothetical protein
VLGWRGWPGAAIQLYLMAAVPAFVVGVPIALPFGWLGVFAVRRLHGRSVSRRSTRLAALALTVVSGLVVVGLVSSLPSARGVNDGGTADLAACVAGRVPFKHRVINASHPLFTLEVRTCWKGEATGGEGCR